MQEVADGKRRFKPIDEDSLLTPELSAEHAQELIYLIDEFFLSVMEQKHDITDAAIAQAAAGIFSKLVLSWRYPFPAMARGQFERSQLFTTLLAGWLSLAAQRADPADYFRQGKGSLWDILIGIEHKRLTDIANGSLQAKWEDERYKAHYDQRTRTWLTEAKQKYIEEIRQAVTELEADAIQLILLCRVLAKEPILVPTGQEREEFRGRVHIQTFADARIELAGILANLKEYTAYYQIGSLHGQVTLAEPLGPGELNEEAIKEVRERSKARYGVPIEPPDEDTPPDLSIPPWSGPPRPPGPRIGRRPPRPEA